MRKSERQLHFHSWKTLSDADVWDGLDIFHEWITIDFCDKLVWELEVFRRRLVRPRQNWKDVKKDLRKMGISWDEVEEAAKDRRSWMNRACRLMRLRRGMNQEPGMTVGWVTVKAYGLWFSDLWRFWGYLSSTSREDVLPPSTEASNGPSAHPRINHEVKNSPSVALTWFHTNNGTPPFTSALVIFLPWFTIPGFKPFPEEKLRLTAAENCFVHQRVSFYILCLLFNSHIF